MHSPVSSLFQKAKTLEKHGDTEGAFSIYAEILEAYPANIRARTALKRIVKNRPTPPIAALNALRESYATAAYQQTLTHAITLAEQFPLSEQVWTLMGASATGLNRPDLAKNAFLQAIKLVPNRAAAHANLAKVMRSTGEFDEAAQHFDQAATLAPAVVTHLIDGAETRIDQGRYDTARALLQKALRLDQGNPQAHLSLGTLHLIQGNLPDALSHLTTATQADPTSSKAFNNLASAFLTQGDSQAAISACQSALRLDPSHATAHQTLANAYQNCGQLDYAVESYERAIALNPNLDAARVQMLHYKAQMCDWSAYDDFALQADTLGITGGPVAPWALLGFEDHPARQRKRAARYACIWQPALAPTTLPARPKGTSRIRIAYISSDIYDHATLRLLTGLLEHHNTEHFDVLTYGLNPPRPSSAVNRLKHCTQFTDLHTASNEQIVAKAHADQVDIAIDLKGYTHGARTAPFFKRLAPLQINYLGYPGTLGAGVYDYIIADEMVVPAAQRAHISEKILYLPHSYQPNDASRDISKAALNRADHDLPDHAIVLCCFNASYKITPDVFDIWMQALDHADRAVLWLLDCNTWATDALHAAAQNRGIQPDRLIFAPQLPQDAHLARHRLADLFVDTFHVNAHTTASDALYAGLPVLTCAGSQFAARVAASLCRATGMDDMITFTSESYCAQLLNFVEHPDSLTKIKERLSRNLRAAPLFDTVRYTQHYEAALRAAWHLHLKGDQARDIALPEIACPLSLAG